MAATLRAIGEPGGAAAISALTSRRPAADLNAWSVGVPLGDLAEELPDRRHPAVRRRARRPTRLR